MKALTTLILLSLIDIGTQGDKTIQFNISSILNARPVSTLNNKKLTTWTKGIDGGGYADGYLTQSAAAFNGDKDGHALPDEPLFPATPQHPEILLHYANNDSRHNQTCNLAGESEVEFRVPHLKYKALYLALTSSEGASNLHIVLTYTSGAETTDIVLPDYYADLDTAGTRICYLAHNLAKWGPRNNMTERDHHNIDLLKIDADPAKVLKVISIKKDKPGYLVFWAAAGMVPGQ